MVDGGVEVRAVRGTLSAAERRGISAVLAAAAEADGVAPLDEAALLTLAGSVDAPAVHLLAVVHSVPLATLRVAVRPVVMGYASVDLGGEVPTAQLVVDPVARRRGIGRALLEAAIAQGPDGGLDTWAHGNLPAAQAFAAAAGLVPAHQLWRMSLDLRRRPVEHPEWPPGFAVRPFAPGHDEDAWLAVNARAFVGHPEQGRWTADDLAAREREPWFDADGFLLAERAVDGSLAGFVWTKVHPVGEPVGEIYVLGVDPSAQGHGLGRALTEAGLAHLVGRGLGTAVLWVAGDNAAAIRTYQRAGFERVALDVRYTRRPQDITGSPDGATMGT